ncbi:MAG TPA: hypothetical protein VK662_15765, partial [Acidothermaceae bacterium]|nr:hypothetical protein [Acidothermaceae bacterium]
MSDERDPLISDALRRLASAAPLPRPDRLEAVVAGVRQRRQVRIATSTLAAVVLVVAAAVGVRTWHTTASDQTVTRPPVPVTSSPAVSPSVPVTSPAASASSVASAIGAPAPTHSAAASSKLAVTVTVPKSVTVGEAARAVMTVTNKGSVATHGGAFTLVNAYAENGTQATGTVSDGHSSGCNAAAPGLKCSVATLQPGHSEQFWIAVAADQQATAILFDI